MAFHAMVSTYLKKSKVHPSRFVKTPKEMSKVKIPPTSSRKKYFVLDDKGLIKEFIEIFPSPKMV